jgi:hypothetical protein
MTIRATIRPVSAACALLDRGWGKPVQTLGGEDGEPLRIVIRKISEEPHEEPLLIEHNQNSIFRKQPTEAADVFVARG